MSEISFREVENRDYGLQEAYIEINGKPSWYKAIIRKGNLVAILGKDYQLFPNEEALKLASQAAKVVGFDPFVFKGKGNVIYNKRQTRMHAFYSPPKTWDVGKETLHIGVDVRNAIDGTSAFGCSVFTFREICSNGVIYGYKHLWGFQRIHTAGFEAATKDLATNMVTVMDKTRDIISAYKRMAQKRITEKLINKIRACALPKKLKPGWMLVEDEQELLIPPTYTEWEAYNDITEEIWHNRKTDIVTKETQFKELHRILPLRVRI